MLDTKRLDFIQTMKPVFVHAVPVCVAGLLLLFAEPSAVFLIGGIAATVTYAYLIWLECRRHPILITPLNCFFFWFGLVLGPTAIYVGTRFSESAALPFVISFVPIASVATGYFVTLLAACFLHLGIVCGLPKALASKPRHTSPLTAQTALICAGVSVLFAHYSQALRFTGSTLGYLFSDLGLAACCLYAVSGRSGFREEWMKIFVLLPATALLAVAMGGQGSKLGIVMAMIPIVWFLLMDRKRRILLVALGAFLALAYILVVTPAVNGARLTVGTGNVTASDIFTAGAQQMDAFAREPQVYIWQSCDDVAQRVFSEPVAVGYIVTRVEAEGYALGSNLEYVIWAAIPRVFWEDKPFVSRGAWFTADIGGSLTEESAGTSTGMTSPGELYWNFGWIGVTAGMWLMGFLIARLWALALPDPRISMIAMLPYVHLLANFVVFQDSEAGSSILNIIQAYLLFLVVLKITQAVRLNRTTRSLAPQF
jgi:O-antigen polysaccharide polymerase Wzy